MQECEIFYDYIGLWCSDFFYSPDGIMYSETRISTQYKWKHKDNFTVIDLPKKNKCNKK